MTAVARDVGVEDTSVRSLLAEVDRLRAELHLREQELAITTDQSPIGLSVVDDADRMIRVNDALCRFLGYREEELLIRNWKELTHPDDLSVGAREIAELFAGRRSTFSVEKRYLTADGQTVWAQVNVALLRDETGAPMHRVTQHVDITARKERELHLEQNSAAEHQVAAELRRLDRIKSALLEAVSHELRTPLTVILGMAETLQQFRDRLQPPERDKLEDALVDHTIRLNALLEDLLELERLGRGGNTVAVELVDAAELVASVLLSSAVANRARLEAPATLLVHTEGRRLRLIVDNLLCNVAKYAPLGPVSVRLTALPDGGLRLDVVDQGPGIPREAHRAVFEPFHRAAPHHPKPGTGIGLSLVARFAMLHGGEAWVEDTEVGAHIVVTLPDLAA